MRKTLFGGLVALALALAPVGGANAAPYPPGSNDDLHGSLNAYVGAPGDAITYTAEVGTFAADEALAQRIRGTAGHSIELASTTFRTAPATEGTFAKAAASDGSHTFTFTIPLSAVEGDRYEIDVHRDSGEVWDHFILTVVAAPAGGPGAGGDSAAGSGSSSSGGLAMTGSDIAIAGIATGAVLLFVGGLVLLLVRRRRSRADAAA